MKINYMKRIISIFLCLCLTACLFSGCSSTGMIDFIYPFSADVNSYDPQVAATSDEFLIIENTFEGLIRIEDDGTVKKGVAESWSVSEDKLTYTFQLKKGLKWDIDTEKYEEGEKKGEFKDSRLRMLGYEFNPDITAHDFVFALQRAVKPETNCPLFPSVSIIKNAVAVHSGKAKASTLGAVAKDDYTLVITLSAPDDAFMQTLTSAVAMPCNEEFFNATKGRYGLDTQYTLFNGQFYVSQILESSYLLKNNEQYGGEYPAEASELTLKIIDSSADGKIVERLESGYYDAAFITGQDTDSIGKNSAITYVPYTDTTWAFLFNTNNAIFQSKTMRNAFCLGLTRIAQPDKEYLSNASNLIPPSCKIGANDAVAAIGAAVPSQDVEKSVALWQKGMKVVDDTDITITVLTPNGMENQVKQMLQGIQSGIGNVLKNSKDETITLTIKVETAELSALDTAIAKKEYDIAFYPFPSSTPSAITYLKGFAESNKTGFDTKALEKAIAGAEKADNLSAEAKYIKAAEREIINSYSIFPMLYETSYYASAKGVSNIQFHAGTGRVSFVNATRKDS